MTYLNTVPNAGTEWLYQKYKTEAIKGLSVIWPSDFTHTHRGIINKDNEKQIKISPKPKNAIELFDQYQDYENQEFLGDRALDFSIAFYIYRKYPNTTQGFKTVLKTKLVKTSSLAKFAKFLDLGKHLIISKQVDIILEN